MHFDITGTIRPEDLEKIVVPLMAMLAHEGVESIDSIRLSFLGWPSEGERLQIVTADGRVTSLRCDAEEIASRPQVERFVLPEGISLRQRSEDKEFSMFSLAAGHDD
ncbi:hypothetical protein [Sphingobium yanoikuyae]|jgi:hypothetical protein|uniref:hypothetical protein n=1 Tax=Sphingobium yanoikuyae TaxID=13690 RepID=UPI00241DC432|nr:hypothetical protein [Sphingobium yanoikuyae]HEV7433588.1 hypothetical protein [Pseudorhizobium sp.]